MKQNQSSKNVKSLIQQTLEDFLKSAPDPEPKGKELVKLFSRPKGEKSREIKAKIAASRAARLEREAALDIEREAQKKADIEEHRLHMLAVNLRAKEIMLERRAAKKTQAQALLSQTTTNDNENSIS